MRYDYVCHDCAKQLGIDLDNPDTRVLVQDQDMLAQAVFELSIPLAYTEAQKAKVLVCPNCTSKNVHRHLVNPPTVVVRGSWIEDKSGARRSMNIHTLRYNDPYLEHRVSGETEEITKALKTGHLPKPKHFDMSAGKPKDLD